MPSNDSDMVLSPEPISYMFPTTTVEPEDQPGSSSVEHLMERKQRNLRSSTLEKTWRASFRLLQCEGVHDTYILEMHEVETGNVTIHQLIAREKEVQMKVLHSDQRISLSPSVHIVNPLHTQQRSNLSLCERLAKWTIEQRKHNNSERRDKFYFHQKVPKKFRSLQEVATFILFNCYKDDLRNMKDIEENEQ